MNGRAVHDRAYDCDVRDRMSGSNEANAADGFDVFVLDVCTWWHADQSGSPVPIAVDVAYTVDYMTIVALRFFVVAIIVGLNYSTNFHIQLQRICFLLTNKQ